MDLTKSFFSLLALINPIGAIPFFISLTESQTDEEKRRWDAAIIRKELRKELAERFAETRTP